MNTHCHLAPLATGSLEELQQRLELLNMRARVIEDIEQIRQDGLEKLDKVHEEFNSAVGKLAEKHVDQFRNNVARAIWKRIFLLI